MTLYSKWSDHADRWIIWESETGEVTHKTPVTYQADYGLSSKQEYYSRYGAGTYRTDEQLIADYETPEHLLNHDTGLVEPFYRMVIDTNIETNPSLYYNGEAQDEAAGRYYGRPLPASAGSQPRPA